MGRIFRRKDTPESLFREMVDDTMSNVLKEEGFESMDELLERGNTYEPYKKTEDELRHEVLKSYDISYGYVGIYEMFGESWVNGKGKVHNYVWQRAYVDVFNSISGSLESVKIMKDYSNEIAYEYGNAIWRAIFDKYQRFFIMLWRMNVSYSASDARRRRLNFLIRCFSKAFNKASKKLSKELERADFDDSNEYVLENVFEMLWEEIKQDKAAFSQMIEISNYFAEDFGKLLWYGKLNNLQRFILVCVEVNRAQQIIAT